MFYCWKYDNQFIGETTLTLVKEMVEGLFKISENSSVLDELSLHFWSDLLKEWELFNDQIIIVKKSLVDVLFDIVVQIRLNMEWLV